ncbi:MAG TPA: ABC transporter permease [Tepidisphaeraceae bacterium]|jgi:ABC-2 type transport system permease protein
MNLLQPSLFLCRRELVRFLRQRSRVIGALATPIVFWVLIGFGMGRSFTGEGEGGYLNYFFPGTVLMILLFTAIFSTISVIEDRREGFLQGVLVAPVGRTALVLGKVLGGSILATGQALLFVLLGWATGIIHPSLLSIFPIIGVMIITSVGLTAMGLCFAWRMNSTQGFHAVMNLVFMPMWFLSGALFPLRDDTPRLFKLVMLANPLHYALGSLRRVFGLGEVPTTGMTGALAISAGFGLVMVLLAIRIAKSHVKADVA